MNRHKALLFSSPIASVLLLCGAANASATPDQVMEGRNSAAYPHWAGEQDWGLYGYKGECPAIKIIDFAGLPYVTGAMVALSADPNRRMAAHGILCDVGYNEYFDTTSYAGYGSCGANCARTWYDYSLGSLSGFPFTNGDWDPYYQKGTCPPNQFVAGISQEAYNTNGVDKIVCLPTAAGYRRFDAGCYVRKFGIDVNGYNNGDSPPNQSGGADWDYKFYKGRCDLPGTAIAGISHNPYYDKTNGGGVHAILCCPLQGTP